jgi:cytochrome c oxidase subunit 2
MNWIRALLYLPPGGSTFADGIDLLHFFVISVTMLAATAIAVATVYFMIRWRRLSPAQPTLVMTGGALAEAGIIAGILTSFLVFWAIGFTQYVELETPPKGAMVVNVTAKQWMWKFSYPGGRRAIDVLTVPVGRPVKLLMTSRDVIHSFYVPAFRIKQDVIPGRYVTAWFQATAPGRYDIYCAEYCGVSHSRMLGAVTVLSQPDYDAWRARDDGAGAVASAGEDADESSDLVALGRAIAARRQCLACHTTDGQRHIGPTWRGLYGATIPLEGGRTVVADEAYLTRSMMDPLAEVHAGFQPVMPTYQGVLEAPEAAAIVEFIESLHAGERAPSGVTLPALSTSAAPPAPSAVSASAPAAAANGADAAARDRDASTPFTGAANPTDPGRVARDGG